jgi:hypothetical protein
MCVVHKILLFKQNKIVNFVYNVYWKQGFCMILYRQGKGKCESDGQLKNPISDDGDNKKVKPHITESKGTDQW